MNDQKRKKIGVIGVGGRTGTMFFEELKNYGETIGIARKKELELIQKGKILVKKREKEVILEGKFLSEEEFPQGIELDYLFVTVRNPISPVLKFYFKKLRENNLKFPILFLSQNGIGIGREALSLLREFDHEENFSIFRISLFNPVEKIEEKEKILISYSLPVKFAIAKFFGKIQEQEVFRFFLRPNFQPFFVPQKEAENMEYSKLFLNLLGMASAKKGLSPKEGFLKKEIFLEEVLAIREYKRVVKSAGGKFLNFPSYPVNFFSFFFSLPLFLIYPLRKKIGQIIEQKREGKPKDLSEIEYYNGAVVKLGEKVGIKTPVNKKILEK